MRPIMPAVLAAALLVPATAVASTASFSRGTLTVTGAGTENNDFSVSKRADLGGYVVTDSGVPAMIPSTSCPLLVEPNALLCRGQVRKVTANLGAGNDVLRRNQFFPATVSAGDGDDTIYGSDFTDVVNPGAGADTFIGYKGRDAYDLRSEKGTVVADGAAGTVTHAGSTDTVQDVHHLAGGAGNDEISGFALMWGGGGDDTLTASNVCTELVVDGEPQLIAGQTLEGQAGNDTLVGGNCADTILGGVGTDVMTGGGGFDIVSYAGQSGALFMQQNGKADDGAAGENDSIAGFEHLRGSFGNDYIKGGGGAAILDGQGGRDRLLGGVMDEKLYGGADADQLFGGTGSDLLDCGAGTDEYVNRDGDQLVDCEVDFEAAS